MSLDATIAALRAELDEDERRGVVSARAVAIVRALLEIAYHADDLALHRPVPQGLRAALAALEAAAREP